MDYLPQNLATYDHQHYRWWLFFKIKCTIVKKIFISLAILKCLLFFCIVNNISRKTKDKSMTNEQLKLENQFCFRLYSAARLMMGAYHPYLDPLGITYPQYLVLLVLWEQDKQPVCDIGKRLMLDTNTMTPLLQRMEKAGLITRTRGIEDTRQRIVSLTKQGRALYEQAQHIPEDMRKAVMMPESKMEEILQLIPLLDKLIEELKN